MKKGEQIVWADLKHGHRCAALAEIAGLLGLTVSDDACLYDSYVSGPYSSFDPFKKHDNLWEVVEEVHAKGYQMRLFKFDSYWQCFFWKELHKYELSNASTAAEAVCIAALRAMGHQIVTPVLPG
jgi:hypothetical protein